jgi:hypothetical protein
MQALFDSLKADQEMRQRLPGSPKKLMEIAHRARWLPSLDEIIIEAMS